MSLGESNPNVARRIGIRLPRLDHSLSIQPPSPTFIHKMAAMETV